MKRNCFTCKHFLRKNDCSYADEQMDENGFAGLKSSGFSPRFAGKCLLGYNQTDYKTSRDGLTDEVLAEGVTPISAAQVDCCDEWESKLSPEHLEFFGKFALFYDKAFVRYTTNRRDKAAENAFEEILAILEGRKHDHDKNTKTESEHPQAGTVPQQGEEGKTVDDDDEYQELVHRHSR